MPIAISTADGSRTIRFGECCRSTIVPIIVVWTIAKKYIITLRRRR